MNSSRLVGADRTSRLRTISRKLRPNRALLVLCSLLLAAQASASPSPPGAHRPNVNVSGQAHAASILAAKQKKGIKKERRRRRGRRAPRGAGSRMPFQTGETLSYELTWMGIPVGTAEFKVTKDTRWKGKAAWHFEMKARTNKYADAIYKVRDHMHAWVKPRMNRSIHHEKKQREGSYHRDVILRFDTRRNRAVYRNQWRAYPAKPIFSDTYDPLGLLYGFRCKNIARKGSIKMSVTDGLKTIRANVKVLGKETLTIAGQPIATWHVVPELKDVGGIFERSPGARMDVWLSADEYRIPVRLKSKVVVGSFVATLINAKGLKG
ncbi:MAG: DUF3108 domain-containing protein [Myxococcales bacterium]|nr:DUF3108 domain-containing protein [Myxococcales bacterium]